MKELSGAPNRNGDWLEEADGDQVFEERFEDRVELRAGEGETGGFGCRHEIEDLDHNLR